MKSRHILVALAVSTSSLGASCINDVLAVEVQVDSCVSAVAYSKDRVENELGWVREFVSSLLEQGHEIVITGRVLREARVVEPSEEALEPAISSSRVGSWVLGPKGATCSGLNSGEVLLFLEPRPCCDVLPPQTAACLLEIGYLEPLSESLSRQFGSR